MAIKIDSNVQHPLIIANKKTDQATLNASNGRVNSQSSQSRDSVNITSEAQSMHVLHNKIVSASAVDAAKVAVIKQAIATGSYQINNQNLARKLLELEGELLME